MRLPLRLLALVCSAAGPLRAQFYAPPVDFHDQAQRRFPVEAARVLAWIHDGGKPGISEVTYQVEMSRAGETLWTIKWVTPGKPEVQASVRYPQEALRTGPEWYRSVWKQLDRNSWAKAGTPEPDLAGAYWEGAASAGLTRLEGISSALKQLQESPSPTGRAAARLSGTLVQSALSSLGATVTLDGALVARAAAWLCAAEKETGHPAGPEWAPILTLSGRGPAGVAAWGKKPSERPLPAWHCWDLLVRQPSAADALTTIALPANRLYAAKLFSAYGWIDPAYDDLFRELARQLYPGDSFTRLLDYGPTLNKVRGTEPPGQTFPMRFVQSWLDVLRTLTPLAGDAVDAPAQARAIHDLDAPYAADAAPTPELAALMNRGGRHAEGPLVPVAAVTANDLLIYGWDFGAIQWAALHGTWSIHPAWRDKARAVENGWLAQISGWTPFNINSKVAGAAALESTQRYEFIAQTRVARLLNQAPPPSWNQTPEAYGSRRWLLDPHRALEFAMQHGGTPAHEAIFLRRVLHETGQYHLGALISNTRIFETTFGGGRFPEANALQDELLRAAPASGEAQVALVNLHGNREGNPFGFATALERAHWNTGLPLAPRAVFLNYVRANAITSAFRFYDRWHDAVTESPSARAGFAKAAFALAVLQSDAARTQVALKDADLHATLTAALLKNDVAAATRAIDQQIQQFPRAIATPAFKALRDEFLPLLPALQDPKHPDHEKALGAFPKQENFLFDQWVVYARAHLSREDAVRFFDAPTVSGDRALIVAAIKGDQAAFRQIFAMEADPLFTTEATDVNGQLAPRAVLYAWLKNLLLKTPPPAPEPDLMPAGARPLLERLREMIGK